MSKRKQSFRESFRESFSIEGSTSTTWTPSKKNAIKEIERLKSLGKRKIVVRKLVKKGNNFVEGKRVNVSNLLKGSFNK